MVQHSYHTCLLSAFERCASLVTESDVRVDGPPGCQFLNLFLTHNGGRLQLQRMKVALLSNAA